MQELADISESTAYDERLRSLLRDVVNSQKTFDYVTPMMHYEGNPHTILIGNEESDSYTVWMHDKDRQFLSLACASGSETRYRDARVKLLGLPNGDLIYTVTLREMVQDATPLTPETVKAEITAWPLGAPEAYRRNLAYVNSPDFLSDFPLSPEEREKTVQEHRTRVEKQLALAETYLTGLS